MSAKEERCSSSMDDKVQDNQFYRCRQWGFVRARPVMMERDEDVELLDLEPVMTFEKKKTEQVETKTFDHSSLNTKLGECGSRCSTERKDAVVAGTVKVHFGNNWGQNVVFGPTNEGLGKAVADKVEHGVGRVQLGAKLVQSEEVKGECGVEGKAKGIKASATKEVKLKIKEGLGIAPKVMQDPGVYPKLKEDKPVTKADVLEPSKTVVGCTKPKHLPLPPSPTTTNGYQETGLLNAERIISILDFRTNDGKNPQYLVRWNTMEWVPDEWVDEKDCQCVDAIHHYWETWGR